MGYSKSLTVLMTIAGLVGIDKAQQDVAKSTGGDSEEYRKLGFQIRATKKELESIPAATEPAGNGFKGVRDQLGFTKDGLVGQLTQLGVGLIGVQAIFTSVGAAFTTDSAFQSALSSLSALTEAGRGAGSCEEQLAKPTATGLSDTASCPLI
jgi:hypothetical protein